MPYAASVAEAGEPRQARRLIVPGGGSRGAAPGRQRHRTPLQHLSRTSVLDGRTAFDLFANSTPWRLSQWTGKPSSPWSFLPCSSSRREAVLILRPIAGKLGTLLDAMAREKSSSALEETRRLRETVEAMNERLSLLEERQDFTERLIEPRTSGGAGPPEGEGKR